MEARSRARERDREEERTKRGETDGQPAMDERSLGRRARSGAAGTQRTDSRRGGQWLNACSRLRGTRPGRSADRRPRETRGKADAVLPRRRQKREQRSIVAVAPDRQGGLLGLLAGDDGEQTGSGGEESGRRPASGVGPENRLPSVLFPFQALSAAPDSRGIVLFPPRPPLSSRAPFFSRPVSPNPPHHPPHTAGTTLLYPPPA